MPGKKGPLIRPVRLPRRRFLKWAAGLASGLFFSRWLPNTWVSRALAAGPRVVSVSSAEATSWDFAAGYHWDFINQDAVNRMVDAGVAALTGIGDLGAAWRSLVPYQAGQAVVLKVNLNNAFDCNAQENRMDAYPETINAVIRGLKMIGVPGNRIWIADPSRVIPYRFRSRIIDQNVRFYMSVDYSPCAVNCYPADYVDAGTAACSYATYPAGDCIRPAQVFVDAHHLISIPLLKGHWGAGITLGLKNHYGSVRFTGGNQWSERNARHVYIYKDAAGNPDPNKSLLADVNNNPHIRYKTRLTIGDGLFGHSYANTEPPERWNIFGNKSPNILFFGRDPVAVDSVMGDYLNAERAARGIPLAFHPCLHYAQTLGLGVHDHWSGPAKRRYTYIDYVEMTLSSAGIAGILGTLLTASLLSLLAYPKPGKKRLSARANAVRLSH
ncbi:MAG: DUF362 domain-containing protein [Syntrophaceae bacterium]|nr:DUF362 domain-containing protein [Syntrophaceae bacterium]